MYRLVLAACFVKDGTGGVLRILDKLADTGGILLILGTLADTGGILHILGILAGTGGILRTQWLDWQCLPQINALRADFLRRGGRFLR